MKRLLMGALATLSLAAAAGATSVPTASATDTTVVRLLSCALDTGSITVPAGSNLAVNRIGYAEGSYGLINVFLRSQTTTLTIDRNGTTSVVDLSTDWLKPEQIEGEVWWIAWLPNPMYTLDPLASGESVTLTFDEVFSHPLLIAYPPVGPTGDNGPFLNTGEDGPFSCLITAE